MLEYLFISTHLECQDIDIYIYASCFGAVQFPALPSSAPADICSARCRPRVESSSTRTVVTREPVTRDELGRVSSPSGSRSGVLRSAPNAVLCRWSGREVFWGSLCSWGPQLAWRFPLPTHAQARRGFNAAMSKAVAGVVLRPTIVQVMCCGIRSLVQFQAWRSSSVGVSKSWNRESRFDSDLDRSEHNNKAARPPALP